MGRSRDLADGTLAELNVDSNTLAVDATNNRVGIGTASPSQKVDVVGNGAPSSAIISMASNETNSNAKYGYYAVKHYTNAEEPLGLIQGESNASNNYVNVGGGNGETNAATLLRFYTAANTSTTVGTNWVTITAAGEFLHNVGIGTTSPSTALQVNGTVTATSFSGSGAGLTGISGTITTTSGSPAYYGARSFINMQGDGTVTIRNSQNVSSISDDGVGMYTINFSTAMPDANFTVVSQGSWTNANTSDHSPYVVAVRGRQEDSHNASWVKMAAGVNYQPGLHSATRYDADTVEVAIFR